MTGGSGLLGRELLKRFKAEKWECLGLAYSRVREGLVKVDIRNRGRVGVHGYLGSSLKYVCIFSTFR